MSFGEWAGVSSEVRGNQPLWPWIIGKAIDEEFVRQRSLDMGYEGEIFKDRDDDRVEEGTSEELMVKSLYRACSDGCLSLGGEPIWLLGYQWPNQGGNAEKRRQADLVGITIDGGLVVFECKLGTNPEPPLVAAVQGLNYLAHLLQDANFQKIVAGFRKWLAKPGKVRPNGFEATYPKADAVPNLVVLAPDEYFFKRHTGNSKRGEGWWDFAAVADQAISSVRVRFATIDFQHSCGNWITRWKPSPKMEPRIDVRERPHEQFSLWSNDRGLEVKVVGTPGGSNTRIRLMKGMTILVPNEQLHPIP